MRKLVTPGFERIDKREARKRYKSCETLLLVPCNVDPNNRWGMGFNMNITDHAFESDFDRRVTYFEYYNCQYSETGKYTAFYLRKES